MKVCRVCLEEKDDSRYRARAVCIDCVNAQARAVPRPAPDIIPFPLWPPPGKARFHSAKNRGEDNARAKLTLADVEGIRKGLAEGRSHSAVAREYGVCKSSVTRINTHKTWA